MTLLERLCCFASSACKQVVESEGSSQARRVCTMITVFPITTGIQASCPDGLGQEKPRTVVSAPEPDVRTLGKEQPRTKSSSSETVTLMNLAHCEKSRILTNASDPVLRFESAKSIQGLRQHQPTTRQAFPRWVSRPCWIILQLTGLGIDKNHTDAHGRLSGRKSPKDKSRRRR